MRAAATPRLLLLLHLLLSTVIILPLRPAASLTVATAAAAAAALVSTSSLRAAQRRVVRTSMIFRCSCGVSAPTCASSGRSAVASTSRSRPCGREQQRRRGQLAARVRRGRCKAERRAPGSAGRQTETRAPAARRRGWAGPPRAPGSGEAPTCPGSEGARGSRVVVCQRRRPPAGPAQRCGVGTSAKAPSPYAVPIKIGIILRYLFQPGSVYIGRPGRGVRP